MNKKTTIEQFSFIKDEHEKIKFAYDILTTIDSKISNGIYTKSFILAIYGILVESKIIVNHIHHIDNPFFLISIILVLVVSIVIVSSYNKMKVGRAFLSLVDSKGTEKELTDLISEINKRKDNLDNMHKFTFFSSSLLIISAFASFLFDHRISETAELFIFITLIASFFFCFSFKYIKST